MSDHFPTTDYVRWLKGVAKKAGKGSHLVDGRALGCIADRIESLQAELKTAKKKLTNLDGWISGWITEVEGVIISEDLTYRLMNGLLTDLLVEFLERESLKPKTSNRIEEDAALEDSDE